MTTPPGGVRAGRAATLIGRWDKGDYDAIRFIQVRDTVHVIAAGEDRPVTAIDRLIDDAEALAQLRFMLGEEWSVCGVRFVRHRGGFEQGARLLSHFPDELLCGLCCATFGDRSVIIFEANQDDGEDPTQLGQLDADLVSKAHRPLR